MNLGVDTPRAAVVAIDCHRGHLDPAVATMPAPPDVAKRLTAANKRFLDGCRKLGIPVIHCVTTYRDVAEIRTNPFWRARAEDPNSTRKNVLRHNLANSPGCTIMPGLLDVERDSVVNTKKRYDCFIATDLDFRLKSLGVSTVCITGINTNSCVLATTIAANVRDYAVVVVEDCVDTMDGEAHHDAALNCIKAAFGFVLKQDEVLSLCRTWASEAAAAE